MSTRQIASTGNDSRRATRAVRAGIDRDPAFGAVTPPLVLSSNFSFAGFGEKRQYDYTRSGNPTRDLLGEALAELEGGAGGVVTATGMGAITLVLNALLQPGDKLVVPHDCYGGSWRLFNALAKKNAFDLITCDLTDPRAFAEALEHSPTLVWIETPSNPLLRISDIAALATLAHAHGALLVVDNTFATPALQQPLALGADVVVHSTTKYLGGHSDVVGGALVLSEAHRGGPLADEIGFLQFAVGAVSGPLDAWLTTRGIKTLAVRMQRHSENAASVAAFLQGHERVARVYYPGLVEHPGHDLAARQMSGFGGIVSVALESQEAARRFAESTRLFQLAESLGGVESLVNYPDAMTHASVRGTDAAVPVEVVRLSVGIEDIADLLDDLAQALAA